jgi:hypothetical protein
MVSSIVLGIDNTSNQWGVLQYTGEFSLVGCDISRLAPSGINVTSSHFVPTVKFIGDGFGNYGFSLSLRKENKPFIFAILLDHSVFQSAISKPILIANLIETEFNINPSEYKNIFGFNEICIDNGFFSKIALFELKHCLAREKILYVSCNQFPKEQLGFFDLLFAVWSSLSIRQKSNIEGTYPLLSKNSGPCLKLNLNSVNRFNEIPNCSNFTLNRCISGGFNVRPIRHIDWLLNLF